MFGSGEVGGVYWVGMLWHPLARSGVGTKCSRRGRPRHDVKEIETNHWWSGKVLFKFEVRNKIRDQRRVGSRRERVGWTQINGPQVIGI